ncbi:MAG TPA: tetratricopeptide repeat protein [Ignavibacteriaceae bacterium]|nr:tetratricopeptide repeat protein [Ignavibacteriaceae bacterium]
MQNRIYSFSLFLTFLIISFVCGCTAQDNGAQGLLNEGARLFQQGKYDEAILKYKQAVEKDPGSAIGYNLLGMAYRFKFNQSGTRECKNKEIESFKKAIGIDSSFWAAYKNLSASLYYEGRKKEAVPYLERALELQPDDPEKAILLKWIEEGKK